MDALLRRRAMIAAGGSPTPPGPVIEPVFYDRLVFDGTAYIDTDIIPPADCSFRVILGNETIKAAQRAFMVRAGTSDQIGMIYNSSTNATNRVIAVYYGGASVLLAKQLAFSTAAYSFFLTPKRMGWGSTGYTITKGSSTPTEGLVIGTRLQHDGQAYTGRMGRFFIYGSDAQNATSYDGLGSFTPVYTLRPCTYDGEAGLWCVETSKFYGNTAGAGALSVMNNS